MNEKIKLIDICSPKQWKTIATNQLLSEGEFPVYGANGIIGYFNEFNHEEPTVLITCRGATCGNIHISLPKSYINGNAMALDNLNEKICLKEYLYYFLSYYDMTKIISGTAQPQITIQGLKKIYVKLYSIEEQKNIVYEMNSIKKIIDIRKKQIEKLDELIKSQFVEMFEDDTYSRVKLGEEFDVSSGGTPSKTKVEYWNSNDISWIGSNMCQNKIIYENDGKYISKSGLEHSSAKVYPVDTVLVALVGATIGKTALLKFETATNQNIAGIQVSERFNAEYVYFAIQNLYYKFTELGKGTFKMANLSFVRNLEIPMPPIELQNKFADFVKQIDKQKFEIQKSLEQMQNLYESLMNQYFK